MAKTVKVRKVVVECPQLSEITDEKARITSCRLECQVNSPSRAIIGVAIAEPANPDEIGIRAEKAEYSLRDLLTLSGDYQASLFDAKGNHVELFVKNYDIDGTTLLNEVVVAGVLSAPTFRVVAGKLTTTFSVLSKDSLMEAFNPSIYANVGHTHGGSTQNTPDLFTAFRSTFNSNNDNVVSSHIRNILKLTARDEDSIFKREMIVPSGATGLEADNNRIIFENAHTDNNADDVLPVIEGLLSRSDPLTTLLPNPGDWDGSPLGDDAPNLFEAKEGTVVGPRISLDTYHSWLLREFLGSKNFYNFLLQSVCPGFLFDYVCPFYKSTTPTSRIQHSRVNAQSPGIQTAFVEEVKSISLNLASSYQRPIAQMIVHGSVLRPHGAMSGTATPLGAHPPSPIPKGGKVINQAAPGWWSSAVYNEQQLEATPKDAEGILGSGRQINKSADAKTDTTDRIQGLPDEKTFLQNWATLQYGNMTLQHTHAAVIIPLDLSWGGDNPSKTIGERIQVSGRFDDDIVFFEGFLQAVSHEISVEGGSHAAAAQTHLEFSHIKTYSSKYSQVFQLPGDVNAANAT
tara:strand:- start:3834 stop:5549 length:1716 start_codon:yes stop_codon:yes gene_type:complete